MAGVLATAAIALAAVFAAGGVSNGPGLSSSPVTVTGGAGQMADDDATMGGLAGRWVVTGMADATLPPEAEVTMVFGAGQISGFAACSSYAGTATVEGDGLNLGPIERDGNLCEEELMEAEASFMHVLQVSDRFRIAEDGTLTLLAQEREMVTARRADPL